MDNCSDTDNSVAAGIGEQLHDGRIHSYPAGNCHYRDSDQHHSGAETFWITQGYRPDQTVTRKKEQNEKI